MKMKSYVIYKVTNGGNFTYVGMTTQPLATRYRQHKADAVNEKCSISNKLCQKTDLAGWNSMDDTKLGKQAFNVSS